MKKITAAVCNKLGEKLVIDDNIELADPSHNEVLVKLISSGICHTDIIARDDKSGRAQPKYPFILGHEGAGIVEKVGPGVKDFAVGDHVVTSVLSCGECEQCLSGHDYWCEKNSYYLYSGRNLYEEYKFFRNGEPVNMLFNQASLASHTIVNVRQVVKVPDSMDMRIAAPMGCGCDP